MHLEAQASSSTTSDAAEFEALIAGLETAIKHGIKHILACGHSQQVYQHVRLHFMNCLKHFHELETLQNHNPSFKTPMIWRQNDAHMVIDLSGLYLKMNQTNYRYVLCLLQSFKVSSVLSVVVLHLKLKITC
jgi:ribonuclease HI